jgi:hypothetical protein
VETPRSEEAALHQSGPINDIAQRWIAKFERNRLQALADLKKQLEREDK